MIQYEIFTDLAALDIKTTKINLLFDYPNLDTKTTTYRAPIKHKNQDLWAAAVCQKLTIACFGMTSEERALYYDDSDLKDYQFLIDNGWVEAFE